MRRLRKTVRLAQEMGEGLGQCALLFGSLPQSAIGAQQQKGCRKTRNMNIVWKWCRLQGSNS
jgi:hypothetical protein